MDLWHSWFCHHGMRVRAALAEKGIPHRSRLIPPGEAVPGFDGVALASIIATLPPDWRPRQLGLEHLARWERAVMSRPAVRDQMAPVGHWR